MSDNREPGERSPQEDERGPKRAYVTPRLIEYGSVAKLTRGTRSVQGDGTGGGFAKKSCL